MKKFFALVLNFKTETYLHPRTTDRQIDGRLEQVQAHKLTSLQAHKRRSSQAHKLTSSQAHKLTSSQAYNRTQENDRDGRSFKK